MKETIDEEKCFDYWLSVGTASALSPKWRIAYLDKIKELYMDTLCQLNSAEIKIAAMEKDKAQLEKEIEELKSINADLTEESMWHNLQVNPNDLPKRNERYLVRDRNNEVVFADYYDGTFESADSYPLKLPLKEWKSFEN